MEPIDGLNPSEELPDRYWTDPAWQTALGFSMVDGIAALRRVDFVARGLGDLGRAEGWLDRQVPRWRKQLDSYAASANYPGHSIPEVDEVGDW